MIVKSFKKFAIMMLVMCTIVANIFLVQVNAEEIKDDRIHFLAVGYSDATIVESNGHYGLIDASNPIYNEYTGEKKTIASAAAVIRYLNRLGVDHLDFVIGTHAHWDHIGGIPDIAEAGFIDEKTTYINKQYYMIDAEEDKGWHNYDFYNMAIDAVKQYGATVLDTSSRGYSAMRKLGATYIPGAYEEANSIQFQFEDYTIRLYNLTNVSVEDENTNCIVTLIIKGNVKTVLMSDMNVKMETEQKIIRAITNEYGKVDIYRIGHHADKYSTCFETIYLTQPKYGILSATNQNNAGTNYHWFKQFGTTLYQTGDANIAIVADITNKQPVIYTYDDGDNLTTNINEMNPTILTGWRWYAKDSNKYDWVYVNSNRALAYGWKKVDGQWYYMNQYGIRQSDWKQIDGKWYHFNSSGVMDANKWLKSKGEWYYVDGSGQMVIGWKKIKGEWYYFNSDGVMQKNWKDIAQKWYYLYSSGNMAANKWIKSSGKWYYLQSSGEMVTGWKQISREWYYFNNSGVMQTGWKKISGKWYYFESNGIMARNKDIGKYHVNGKGEMDNK